MEENIMLELLLSEEEAAKQQLSKQKVVEIAREICPEEYMGMGSIDNLNGLWNKYKQTSKHKG